LNALLDKYADEGITAIEDIQILKIHPLDRFGTPKEIIDSFGSKSGYEQALRELESHLYEVA